MPNGSSSLKRVTLYLLFAIAAAQQQQKPSSRPLVQGASPPENAALRPVTPINNSPLNEASIASLAPNYKHKKDTAPLYLRNERAVATIAPVEDFNPAVRAPPAKPAAGPSGALSPRRARSLLDWEVENLVLLATVDGSIYARDRTTGQELWKFYSEKPMVETTYHRGDRDKNELGDTDKDDLMWIVEPSQDGSLYVLSSGPDVKIHKLGLTVKQLHELSPYASEDSPFVYTAEKKNTLITLNATNGVALKYFSAGGSGVVGAATCRKVSGLEVDDDDECEPTPTIHLGRTDYTIGIQDRDTGEDICTIKYFEWTPNNRDRDLQAQYLTTLDSKYIYSRFDGGVIALEHKKQQDQRFLYKKKFSDSPIVQVFDVARPQGADVRDIPLVILPQPTAPTMTSGQAENVFLNCTDAGSWYALSEASYPSVTDGAAEARCYQTHSRIERLAEDDPRPIQPAELVGVHSLRASRESGAGGLTIGGPAEAEAVIIPPFDEAVQIITPSIPPQTQIDMPGSRSGFITDASWTSVVLVVLLCYIAFLQSRNSGITFPPTITKFREIVQLPASISPKVEHKAIEAAVEEPEESPFVAVVEEIVEEAETGDAPTRTVRFAVEEESQEAKDTIEATEELAPSNTPDSPVDTSEINVPEVTLTAPAGEDGSSETTPIPPSPEAPKKKKTHRGQRGGRKRNKNKTQDKDKEEVDDDITRIVEGVVRHNETMQPDEQSMMDGGVQDVSGSVQLNNLVVHNDKILGYGSGGTVVYEGTFEGREVAVKRMLLQYFDLASQEVSLLQQSDDHPNVIRYFCHQKGRDFLYIAVERCQASLWDLFKEGGSHDSLPDDRLSVVSEINTNVTAALYQLAAGLSHLHSLRIIHRDIKPQNILVAYPKKNQKGGPRFVISDFGLCRTLPDNVSTLAGTMGNAGTIGWKAPELIGQSRDTVARDGSLNGTSTDPTASTNGQSSLTSDQGGLSATSNGGVKRAVDIFSLGCVFYYVLTNGFHPYDSDSIEVWHVERELNIKKGQQNFNKLQDLGGDSEEPMHLISWMLETRPEDRPTAHGVLAHPFFWSKLKRLNFLCDVSDHFERECRDPPTQNLLILEKYGESVHGGDFMRKLDRKFLDTLGKQRKYTGDRMLDLLRALRNKKNHYADMPDDVKAKVGELPGGYLDYWTSRFPNLLMQCWQCVWECEVQEDPRFKGYIYDG